MVATVRKITAENWEPWTDELLDRCFSDSTSQQLSAFFKVILEKVEKAGRRKMIDLSDRTLLKIEQRTEAVMFHRIEDPKNLMLGDKLTIKVIDPNGHFLSLTCFMRKANYNNQYVKLFWMSEVSVWGETNRSATQGEGHARKVQPEPRRKRRIDRIYHRPPDDPGESSYPERDYREDHYSRQTLL